MIDLDLFLIPQGTLPWQPYLGDKGKMTFMLTFQNGLELAVQIQEYSMAIFYLRPMQIC